MSRRSFASFAAVCLFAAIATTPAIPAADELDAVRAEFLEKVQLPDEAFEVKVLEEPTTENGLVIEKFTFPSAMKSVDPEINDTVPMALLHVEDPAPAAVILLCGWGGESLTTMLGGTLARETKIQVLHVHLPFQEKRTPKGKRSGELTLCADLEQSVASFTQAVMDVRRAVRWLIEERGVDPKRIGLMGTSLGGFISASLYGMDDTFAGCVSQLAGADVAKVIFNGNFLTAHIRAGLAAQEIDEDEARAAILPVAPSTWARAERKDGLLVIAAEKDTIVTLDNAKALAKLYGDAELIVMEGESHIAFTGLQKTYPKAKAHLLARLGFEADEEK